MVIVVTGCVEPAGALATELGWNFVAGHAGHSVLQMSTQDLHAAAERALDRREHLVIAWPQLQPDDRTKLRGLRTMRIVALESPDAVPTVPPGGDDLRLDATRERSSLVQLIRRELGQ